jgi:hypothetical protein
MRLKQIIFDLKFPGLRLVFDVVTAFKKMSSLGLVKSLMKLSILQKISVILSAGTQSRESVRQLVVRCIMVLIFCFFLVVHPLLFYLFLP